MKKFNISINWLYLILTFVTTFLIILPLLFWLYDDLKTEAQKDVNRYFQQTKSMIELIIENRVKGIDGVLNNLALDVKNIEQNLENLEDENIDILFYKVKNKDEVNLSSNFLYDTKSIIEYISKYGLDEKKHIINMQLEDSVVSIVYSFKKIIQKRTGRVLGIVCAGQILNNNLGLLNEIKQKASLKSVSFEYEKNVLATTMDKNSNRYEILTQEFPKNLLYETKKFIYYKNALKYKETPTAVNVVLSIDNIVLENLEKEFTDKATVMVLFFIFLTILGYYITKRFLFSPLNRLTKFSEKGDINKKFTIVKEINFIVENLYRTLRFLDEYKKAVDAASIVSKGDLSGNITYVNENFCKTTGYSKEELIGRPHSMLRDPAVDKSVFYELWTQIRDKKETWVGYISNKKKNGEIFYIKLTVTPIINRKGEIVEYIALRENITELIESKQKLQKIYTTDRLTELYTRYQLTLDLKEESKLILVLINIDSFSEINDFYGNIIGDSLLLGFSNILKSYFENKSFRLYRVYGDEFAVTINSSDVDKCLIETKAFLEILANKEFEFEGLKINISATAGISQNYGDKFTSADLALKSAKRDKLDCEIFHQENQISKEHENNIYWTRKIKDALLDDRIETYYQAIRNNTSGEIEKFEVLVRLIRPNGNVVSPFFFLDIAKKSKLYDQITRRVVERSFEYFSNKDYEFSINLTIDDILNKETVEFIEKSLKKYDVAKQVVFEIVESERIENFEAMSKFIDSVKAHGCKVAIDDFGTGYSNFEYLIKLNVDYIKIDGSLTKNMIEDKNIFSVVETIVNFAKKTDLKVIAEFVSSKELQDKVEELGIDYSQGYYFGEPHNRI